MIIPFGEKKPTEEEARQLEKLGIDLNSMVRYRKFYYFTLPNNPRISSVKIQRSLDIIDYKINFNGVNVINIVEKTTFYDSYIAFHLLINNIDLALAKSKDYQPVLVTRPVLTEYQIKVKKELNHLGDVIIGDWKFGYHNDAADILQRLKSLRSENPVQQDQLINANSYYKLLFGMFPEWDSKIDECLTRLQKLREYLENPSLLYAYARFCDSKEATQPTAPFDVNDFYIEPAVNEQRLNLTTTSPTLFIPVAEQRPQNTFFQPGFMLNK